MYETYSELGYNYRMTDIQGALGCAQIDRVGWILERRRLIAERYDEMLADLDWLQTPRVPHGSVHGYQSYVCLLQPEQPTPENVDRLNEQRHRSQREATSRPWYSDRKGKTH